MYVTRTISEIRRQPELLEAAPPEGPCSGVLVIQDEEAEAEAMRFFGLYKDTRVRKLPIPQNKKIDIRYTSGSGDNSSTSHHHVLMIPVPNRPLSAHRYYIIEAKGKHQGEAHASSREEDMEVFCFCTSIQDVKPRPLDPNSPFQQFQILRHQSSALFDTYHGFESKSVALDAFPPSFLRRRGWTVHLKTPKNFKLGEAQGLNASLRARIPELEFPIGDKTSAHVEVGKWYVPFMFVKESGLSLKEQMKQSMYYAMTLEQRWEKIFETENMGGKKAEVSFEVCIETDVVLLGGTIVVDGFEADGVMWYKTKTTGDVGGVGLSLGIIERLKWEQERAGWHGDGSGRVMVKKTEEFSGGREWQKFACYVLVERFALRRLLDGSLLLASDFYHTQQTKNKWE